MGVTLILAPVIIASWPAISAAVAGAAVSMGFAAKESLKDKFAQSEPVKESVEIPLTEETVTKQVSGQEQIILTRGTVELRVKRDARGRCVICASGQGRSQAELKQMAQEFSQKVTQCFVYNKVMSELRSKGFKVVNEEMMQDQSVRLHVRNWVE